jgi:hypothetical protein
MAEGVGFEPTREREPPGGFQDRCLKPLGHPSLPGTSNIYACLTKEETNLANQFHRRRACYQVRREPANAVTARVEVQRAPTTESTNAGHAITEGLQRADESRAIGVSSVV